MARGKVRREFRNGLARLDADLVRTVERPREVAAAQALALIIDLARLQQAASRGHVGGHELLEHRPCLGATRDRQQAALQDIDPRGLRPPPATRRASAWRAASIRRAAGRSP